jgi:hypothetical protein
MSEPRGQCASDFWDWSVELNGQTWRMSSACGEAVPCQHDNSLNKTGEQILELVRDHPEWKETNRALWNHFGGGVSQEPVEPDEP